ncbi:MULTISPECIES: type III-B CRISPR module RAMP protein Cmr4 [unclassified Mesotoga]|uniref:type III-B CRISPR module RAMP protein Cmr4 n=1 Tax=unclassified Mesotoga TaxID=1184398 RepID=UPI000DA67E85|nr:MULTISPECIES: type III-B CRISPR module RAMP protein Cmr4 [unclassified Mesotoga]PZC51874.1 CRISPR-associated protein Cmr4 [Mesotoga sp. TolDC]
MSNELYSERKFIFMTLDPIHIGTGGTNLGIVDNTIMREAGSNIPIIPGTSLSGAAKMYAAMFMGDLDAAGSKKPKSTENPVSYTFGYINGSGSKQTSKAGVVSFSDARIVLFPVCSSEGTIWVTTRAMLNEIGFDVKGLGPDEEKAYHLGGTDENSKIKIGWLFIDVENIAIEKPKLDGLAEKDEWKVVEQKIYIVSDKLFTQIVNDNLETRTSVAINPETGAAEDAALFTYEAIPRATWFISKVIQDDFRSTGFKTAMESYKGNERTRDWNSPMDVVRTGFKVIEFMGIGGMTTRGFGRMTIISGGEN